MSILKKESISTVAAVPLGLAMGTVFGVAMEKAKVNVPQVLREQMAFQNNTMLKLFLVAVAVGHTSILISEKYFNKKRSSKQPQGLAAFRIFSGYDGNVLGGLFLGTGMTLAGACPGTVFVQLATGVPYAWLTLIGAYVGTLVYARIDSSLKSTTAATGKNRLDHLFNISENKMGLLYVAALSAVVAAASVYKSSSAEFASIGVAPPSAFPNLYDQSWSPIVSGLIIGLLQFPALFFMNALLGTSSSYCTSCSALINNLAPSSTSSFPYLSSFKSGANNYWQVALTAGLFLGGLLSSSLSGVQVAAVSWSPLASLVGGFCLQFGSRLAGGCTSGHGISGLATLALSSFVTIAATFAGGIAVRALLGA